jgi:UDP-galactopyranose mutase
MQPPPGDQMLQSTITAPHPQTLPLHAANSLPPWIDIIAFSPTRWDDPSNRPRELMTRSAQNRRVFFFEEPVFDAADDDYLEIVDRDGVNVLIPHLKTEGNANDATMAKLVGLLLSLAEIHEYVFWYFSPFPVHFTGGFSPRCKIYDCVNEPCVLRDAFTSEFAECERELRSEADIIFTADLKLYLATSSFRSNVHLFVDANDPRPADWDQLWQQMNRIVQKAVQTQFPQRTHKN